MVKTSHSVEKLIQTLYCFDNTQAVSIVIYNNQAVPNTENKVRDYFQSVFLLNLDVSRKWQTRKFRPSQFKP